MEWVASQPLPPSKNRQANTRISNLFHNPLRKSSSSKELRQASAGYIAYSKADSNLGFPQSSLLQSSSPSASYGFTTNKARIGRALAEGSGKRKNADDSDFFIPYNGPISPPSSLMSVFGITTDGKQNSNDRRLYLHLNRDGQSVAPTQDEMRHLATKKNVEDSAAVTSLRSSRALVEGLPSAYTHGGRNQSSDQNTSARTIGHQSYIPSSMRFDVSEKDKLPTKGSSSMITSRFQPSISRLAATPNASPAQTLVNTKTFLPLESNSTSNNSSDGNESSINHESSTSTSMTSLRDLTNIGSKARNSHDGPSQSASFKQRARAESASFGSIKSKLNIDDKLDVNRHVALSSSDHVDIEDLKREAIKIQLSAQPADLQERAAKIEKINYSPIAASPDVNGSKVKYDAMQETYRREVKALSNQSGFLEPNSNCEKILMPKPNLRSIKAETKSLGNTAKRDEGSAAAFERYRAGPGSKSSPQLSDKARAQSILGSPGLDSNKSGRQIHSGTTTPLFHHRMPPPTPETRISRNTTRPDSVQIPPRRSSQSRKRRTVQSRSQSRTTKVSFQDWDNDDILDLSVVLAQGRALEEERAKWKEQYRRSILRARSTGTLTPDQKRELAEFKKVRYGDSIIPDVPSSGSIYRDVTTIESEEKAVRRSKSSPNMNRSQFEWHSDKGSIADGRAATCIDFNMSNPFQSRSTPKSQQVLLRKKSKSNENLSGSFTCLPMIYKRARALSTLPVDDEKLHKRQQEQQGELSTPKLERIGSTQVIGKQNGKFTEKGLTSVLDEGSDTKKPLRSPDVNSDIYGIAFSASSPDIGCSTPQDDPNSFAGKHFKKNDYKKSILHDASRTQSDASDEMKQNRPPVMRNDSLGMTQFREFLNEQKNDRDRDGNLYSTNSLPAPPRRGRSSQILSPSTKGTPREEQGYFDSHSEAETSHGNNFLMSPAISIGDYLLTPGAYYTPPLAPVLKEAENIKFDKIGNSSKEVRKSQRSTDGITQASTDESNYSPKSIAAKELWNTDNHSEEAFTDLFFRRPGVFGDRDRSNSDATTKPSGFDMTPKKMPSQYFIEEISPRKSKDSMYRSSLHGKRNSLEIEKMVGSYIEGMSNDGSHDESIQHEPAWNDSTTNVYRQETLRIGRVGDRRPEFQPGYAHDDEYIHESSHDESIGPASSRGRIGSYTASLLMATDTPELLQGEKEKEKENAEQDESRISDVSLANMVRDYIWPTSPKEDEK